MKLRQLAFTFASVAALISALPPAAGAFHGGGVGACEECHDLHATGGQPEGLLRGSDPSSTCLRCHAELLELHNVLSEDGSSFPAGGDFYWLTRSYSWVEDGRVRTSPGDSHGHNVVAVDYGLNSDAGLAVAPGGDYPASQLSCISCHDPHGQLSGDGNGSTPISRSGSYPSASPEEGVPGNYRLLGGRGYGTSGTTFSNGAPVAVSPTDWRETDVNHVDYGSGMSEWCANCHSAMHGEGVAQHPAGEAAVFTGETAALYGAYTRTGELSGSPDSSYLALVPFERGDADPSFLDPASTLGPEAGVSNVMCLTCHRAHASAFRSMGRWDLNATFLAKSHPAVGDEGAGADDAQNSYYGRDMVAEFGSYQRSLCNKCHVGD
jgi:predicted CXXCH cytochrome family protein